MKAVALDGGRTVHATGATTSPDFPTVAPLQWTSGGDWDAFATRLDARGSAILMSTYIGGSAEDFGEAIATDRSGRVYVTGTSRSGDLPKRNPVQGEIGGFLDAFLIEISPPRAAGVSLYYYPRLGGATGRSPATADRESLGLSVVNLGEIEALLEVVAYDAGGTPVAGPGVVNPSSILLGPGSQMALVDSQVLGSDPGAIAPGTWFKIETAEERVAGFFMVFDPALSILDGGDAAAGAATSSILPEVDASGTTRLEVINPGDLRARVTFELVGADGRVRSSSERTLDSNGSVSASLVDLFPGAAPAPADHVRVSSDRAVAAIERFGTSDRSMASLNGLDAAAGSPTLFCPQYAAGGGWRSSISIVNLDAGSGSVRLELLDDEGNPLGREANVPIPGRGKVVVGDRDLVLDPLGPPIQGHVRISSSGIRLAGSIVFGDADAGRFATALPLVATPQRSAVVNPVVSDDTYFTGLAVVNPTDAPLEVELELFDSSGLSIQRETERLPARGRRSRLLTQFFPDVAGREIRSGYVRLTSRGSFASLAILGTHGLSAISAVAARPLPEP